MKKPQLTIDILLTGHAQVDAIFEEFSAPQYTITQDGGVLVCKTKRNGTKTSRRFPADTGLYVGRSSTCAIYIPPGCPERVRVSRKQGIFRYADGWQYESVAKENPTYLNDNPLPPGSVARIAKEAVLGIGPKQRDPMQYAITLKLSPG